MNSPSLSLVNLMGNVFIRGPTRFHSYIYTYTHIYIQIYIHVWNLHVYMQAYRYRFMFESGQDYLFVLWRVRARGKQHSSFNRAHFQPQHLLHINIYTYTLTIYYSLVYCFLLYSCSFILSCISPIQ